VIIASSEDLPDEAAENTTLVSFTQLFSGMRRTEGLFGLPKPEPKIFTPMVRLVSLAAAVLILGIFVFFKYVSSMEARYDALKTQYASLESANRKVLEAQKEVEDLNAALARLGAEKPQDIYTFLTALQAVLGGGAEIRTLTFQNDRFQIEAIGSNPEKLMQGFADNPSFVGVKLPQAVPDPRSGKDRFSLSGAFHAR
jgi:hypothetical protein